MDILELKAAITLMLSRDGDTARHTGRVEYWHGYVMALETVGFINESQATDLRHYINNHD